MCGRVFWLDEMTSRVGSYTCLPCYEAVMAQLLDSSGPMGPESD
jgi:hypothetical protein